MSEKHQKYFHRGMSAFTAALAVGVFAVKPGLRSGVRAGAAVANAVSHWLPGHD